MLGSARCEGRIVKDAIAILVAALALGGCAEEGSSDCVTPKRAWGDQCQAEVYAGCGEQDCAFGYEAWLDQFSCAPLVDCVDPEVYEACVGAIEQIEGCDPYPSDACQAMQEQTWQCAG